MPPTQPGAEDPDDRRGRALDAGEAAGAAADSGCDLGCDGCDGPDCGCDLLFVRLSTVLLVAAAVVPAIGCDGLVAALIRAYQRWLSPFTPRCPGTPSCGRYALDAVHRLGARRGLTAAAHRVAGCHRTAPPAPPERTS